MKSYLEVPETRFMKFIRDLQNFFKLFRILHLHETRKPFSFFFCLLTYIKNLCTPVKKTSGAIGLEEYRSNYPQNLVNDDVQVLK